jgi:hypothetical protein
LLGVPGGLGVGVFAAEAVQRSDRSQGGGFLGGVACTQVEAGFGDVGLDRGASNRI